MTEDLSVTVRKLIVVEYCRGTGAKEDKCRQVRQVFDMKGTLMAEYDPTVGHKTFENIMETVAGPMIVTHPDEGDD